MFIIRLVAFLGLAVAATACAAGQPQDDHRFDDFTLDDRTHRETVTAVGVYPDGVGDDPPTHSAPTYYLYTDLDLKCVGVPEPNGRESILILDDQVIPVVEVERPSDDAWVFRTRVGNVVCRPRPPDRPVRPGGATRR